MFHSQSEQTNVGPDCGRFEGRIVSVCKRFHFSL